MSASRRNRQRAVIVIVALAGLLTPVASSSASSSGLNVLVTGNCGAVSDMATALQSTPGVASVTMFDTSSGTPTAATLATQNIVVSLGDSCKSYADATAWGNELAHYADAGGAVLQAAYDNWNGSGSYPTGRFASGGYAPFLLGPNDNVATTLGTVLKPNSPIVQGLGTFSTDSNTTDALAPGATLLAKWADGRNAIALKGHVVSTTASADDSGALPDLARLAVNTGNYFGVPDTKISKTTVNRANGTAAFAFKAIPTEPSFQCELRPAHKSASFRACRSGKTYSKLKPGNYTFEVRAVGSVKPDPSPATKNFVIK